jgi:hypothetical protein
LFHFNCLVIHDVEIRGYGTGFEPLRRIDAPLELRNHITAVWP